MFCRSIDRIAEWTQMYEKGILDGSIQGAYQYTFPNTTQSLLFSHSGFRNKFLAYMQQYDIYNSSEIAQYVNTQVINHLKMCMNTKNKSFRKRHCQFEEEVFQAGHDRGGSSKQSVHSQHSS